jgi:hypothetical protein
VQRKVGRVGNTLIGPTLTIIGTYYLDHFVEILKRPMTTWRRSRSSDSKVVIDVYVVMPKPRQKKSSWMNKPTCRNPTLAKCEDETHTPKVEDLDSFGTPKIS